MVEGIKVYSGVHYLNKNDFRFSNEYLKIRTLEGRVLSDDQVLKLPIYSGKIQLEKEWKLRKKSMIRFQKYLSEHYNQATILDLGCGNGWFSNSMAVLSDKYQVYGLDVNVPELEQAARVFKAKNLKFMNGDVFALPISFKGFDVITLNSCVQYFENLSLLLLKLKSMLSVTGEIHIIDSPFYNTATINFAKEQTALYYEKLGVPEMKNNYFHHNYESLKTKDFEILYKPKSKLQQLMFGVDSPFKWIRFKNN